MEELREQGFRMTPQREKILDVFYTLPEGEHLSAEELYQILQKHSSDISLATLYRTLKMLASVGVLRELDFAEDHKHYEMARDQEAPHHHIICVLCGATDEFESPEANVLASNVVKNRNFQLLDVQLKVFVYCASCLQSAPANRPALQTQKALKQKPSGSRTQRPHVTLS
jgi:Fur family transcriptional regulator, ferric uptake regulator